VLSLFELVAMLLVITTVFAYLNHRFVRCRPISACW
jgi:hypothetical protein